MTQKSKVEHLSIKKEIYKFLFKNGYIKESTSKIGPYKVKWCSPIVNAFRDIFLLLKENDQARLQEISKEIIEDSVKK